MARGRKGFKALSPKLQLKKATVMLPAHIDEWLRNKAYKEAKSLSLVLTEILEELKQEKEKASS